jgi:hypothetical protein
MENDMITSTRPTSHVPLLILGWLADEATNTYGGVYFFESEQAMLDCQASDLFAEVAGNPAFSNCTARGFGRLDGPSGVTHA